MRQWITLAIGSLSLLCAAAANTSASVSAEDAAKLGKELTPIGAEQAGNAAGTIPAWEGGITQAPAGYTVGGLHPDPFDAEKPLFTITADNMADYADKLSGGHKALLGKMDTFKMNVYPSHRTASYPQRIYDATRKNAESGNLVAEGNGVENVIGGFPFPILENGVEAIWNHISRWRGTDLDRTYVQAAVTRDGSYTPVKIQELVRFNYSLEGMTPEAMGNVMILFKQNILSPPRLAGRVLLIHETLNQAKENRKAWVYNPGQRRVRRAPNVAFDNPKEGADGLMTFDQLDMFNGSPERYSWTLEGKGEYYVPYNSYKLQGEGVGEDDILKPGHLNTDLLRYELHRMWVIEGKLRDGTRHIYNKRRLYFDEDSWQILISEEFDSRDELWRVSEGHAFNYQEVPTFWYTGEVHYDLQAGRYVVLLSNIADGAPDFTVTLSPDDFSQNSLRSSGRR